MSVSCYGVTSASFHALPHKMLAATVTRCWIKSWLCPFGSCLTCRALLCSPVGNGDHGGTHLLGLL